jgi:phosphatidylglycerophosphate synthase
VWLANALSLSRIPLGIAFWLTGGWTAVAIVAIAALTDALDGNVARYAARRRNVPLSPVGGWLDPLCDKLFVAIVLVAIARVHPLDVLLLATRELLLVPMILVYLARGHRLAELSAAPIGKVTTVVQLVAIACVVAGAPGAHLLAALTGVLGVATVGRYLLRARA